MFCFEQMVKILMTYEGKKLSPRHTTDKRYGGKFASKHYEL